MKIQFMSDLHLEFDEMRIPLKQAPVLVLAGDITVGHRNNDWIVECARVFDQVIYINGNHEYYGQKYNKLRVEQREFYDDFDNIQFLERDCFEYDGVNFIGATLWSKADPLLGPFMSDFSRITMDHNGYRKFSPGDAWLEHDRAREYIKSACRQDVPNVVITHHTPSFQSQGDRYKGRYNQDIISTGYCTNILDMFVDKNVHLWIHGHTHHCVDYVESGIRVVSNQRGYFGHELVDGFSPEKVIEV